MATQLARLESLEDQFRVGGTPMMFVTRYGDDEFMTSVTNGLLSADEVEAVFERERPILVFEIDSRPVEDEWMPAYSELLEENRQVFAMQRAEADGDFDLLAKLESEFETAPRPPVEEKTEEQLAIEEEERKMRVEAFREAVRTEKGYAGLRDGDMDIGELRGHVETLMKRAVRRLSW